MSKPKKCCPKAGTYSPHPITDLDCACYCHFIEPEIEEDAECTEDGSDD